jgi:uncharacterized protein YkwD
MARKYRIASIAAGLVLLFAIAGGADWYLTHRSPVLAMVILVADASTQRTELLQLTNTARTSQGLSELESSSMLDQAAQAKANDMIARNYWGHVGPDDTTPWHWLNVVKYDYISAGENLAYGFSDPTKLIAGWMDSSEHRANMLGAYTQVGFGLSRGDHYQGGANTVVVALYATPR